MAGLQVVDLVGGEAVEQVEGVFSGGFEATNGRVGEYHKGVAEVGVDSGGLGGCLLQSHGASKVGVVGHSDD